MTGLPNYHQQANLILNTLDNTYLSNTFTQDLLDPHRLPQIIQQSKESQQTLFVVSNLFLKALKNNQYIIHKSRVGATCATGRLNGLMTVISTFQEMLNKTKMAPSVANSLIECISYSLKYLSECVQHRDSFIESIKIFFPQFGCGPLTSYDPKIISYFYENSPTCLKILTCLLRYIHEDSLMCLYADGQYQLTIIPLRTSNQVQIKLSYLDKKQKYNELKDKRFSMVFKNLILFSLFDYSVSRIKTIFCFYQYLKDSRFLQDIFYLSLELLDLILTNPESIAEHENELDEDNFDDVPHYIRKFCQSVAFQDFLKDAQLLSNLIGTLTNLTGQFNFFLEADKLYQLLLRIICRMIRWSIKQQNIKKQLKTISSTSQIFKLNWLVQKKTYLQKIMYAQNFYDQQNFFQFSVTLLRFLKIFEENGFSFYRDTFKNFQMDIFVFLKKAIKMTKYRIEDGKKSQMRCILDILAQMTKNQKRDHFKAIIKLKSHEIMNQLFKKISDNDQNSSRFQDFYVNSAQEEQNEYFEEIFCPATTVYHNTFEKSGQVFSQLNFSYLNSESTSSWLHFAAVVLPKFNPSPKQMDPIIKFFCEASRIYSIASLHYIGKVLKQILTGIQKETGAPSNPLWKNLSQSLKIDFDEFMIKIAVYVKKILQIQNQCLLKNGLKFIKGLFMKLCTGKYKNTKIYSQMIEIFSQDINCNLLAKVENFEAMRADYFSTVSAAWVTNDQIPMIYQVLANITAPLRNYGSLDTLRRYFIDLAGILNPLTVPQIFLTVTEVILKDLEWVFLTFLGNNEQIFEAFSSQSFLEVFLNFVYELINNFSDRLEYEVHSEIKLVMEQKLRPYLQVVLNFEYPAKTILIYLQFIKLNPFSPLLPLKKEFKAKNRKFYETLINYYFQNLPRIQTQNELLQAYDFIQGDVILMTNWWEEVIERNMKPAINIKAMLENQVWSTDKQKKYFGRLLYRLSRYDSRYFQITNFNCESAYVQWFMQNIQ